MKTGCGLILLDEGDEVIDALETQKVLKDYYGVKLFSGGNHRFEHMVEALPLIEEFLSSARKIKLLYSTFLAIRRPFLPERR